jgi:hypothetical protein
VPSNFGEAGIAMSNDTTIVGNTEIILADQMRAIFWNAPRRFCMGGAVRAYGSLKKTVALDSQVTVFLSLRTAR